MRKTIARALIMALVLCGLMAAGQATAQDTAASYKTGERVEVKPTTWQDTWEVGVVTGFSYDHSQLIIKSPTAGERAFVMKDVRHIGDVAATAAPQPPAYTPPQAGAQQPRFAPPPRPAVADGAANGAQVGRTGQRVSVAVAGSCCYDGTIIGAGSGAAAGMYMIHFDNPASQDQYAQPKYIYPFGTRNPNAQAGAPAQGGKKYNCVISYIGGKPVCLTTAPPG